MSIVPDNKHGIKAEAKLNKRLGGRLTLASGALVQDKADIKVGGFRIESKSTINDSMSIKYGWLNKVSSEALDHLDKPALAIQFVTGNGSIKKNGSWVAIRERDFQDYMEYLNSISEEEQ